MCRYFNLLSYAELVDGRRDMTTDNTGCHIRKSSIQTSLLLREIERSIVNISTNSLRLNNLFQQSVIWRNYNKVIMSFNDKCDF